MRQGGGKRKPESQGGKTKKMTLGKERGLKERRDLDERDT